jgi:hypothetical protein
LPDGFKHFLWFVLATLCAIPFVFMSALVMVAIFTGENPISGAVGASVFFIPLFLLATVGGIIFIILSWKNGHRYYKPFLAGYILAMLIYWGMLVSSGPW